jgi:hypothetical protein
MKIEIAEAARMTQSGKSLLRLIQNNETPVIDLLVREALQNSLDAGDPEYDSVDVDIVTGTFDPESFNKYLEGVTEALDARYAGHPADYIAVCDSQTVGLTGPLHFSQIKNNAYGNLLKLVYEISKPQEKDGAGGAWGLGKTVYFRVGIGLVLYYSRIRTETGKYEQRLAVSMVENEESKDAILPDYGAGVKRGIAWWGQSFEGKENTTIPITDDEEISRILQTFGLEPYKDDRTGTIIVIPYIDKDLLLKNNQTSTQDEEEKEQAGPSAPWLNDFEYYLKISVQRWYAPRIANPYYKGKFLKAGINGKYISPDEMEPSFQVIQALYNRSIGVNPPKDIVTEKHLPASRADVNLRGTLKSQKAGTLSYVKVNREVLQMLPPYNRYSPYEYYGLKSADSEVNPPVISFTRQPGMIVSYEDSGNWVHGVSPTSPDEFFISIFTLNSENHLTANDETLEEYVRYGEMADHRNWSDHTIGKSNPSIVNKIQKGARTCMIKLLNEQPQKQGQKNMSNRSIELGKILLPPEGYGRKPESGGGGGGKSGSGGTRKKPHLEIDSNRMIYHPDGVSFELGLSSGKKVSYTGFTLDVSTDGSYSSLKKWESEGDMETPFAIKSIKCLIQNINGEQSEISFTLSEETPDFKAEGMTASLIKLTDNNGSDVAYGMRLDFENPSSFKVFPTVDLELFRKDIRPVARLIS